jgi:hypothetical protein
LAGLRRGHRVAQALDLNRARAAERQRDPLTADRLASPSLPVTTDVLEVGEKKTSS